MNDVIHRENDQAVDQLEALMLEQGELVDCPLVHRFTDGMYIRQIFMPKGTLITSKIHKTQHPYTVSLGAVAVSIDGGDWERIVAPYTGITNPGTRRILYILEDCIWTTYHPLPDMKSEYNDLIDGDLDKILKDIEDKILEPHINQITGSNANEDYKKILETNKNLIL
jgi:hypothetical protein